MESGAIEWRIRNNAGASLPATGGPGSTLLYVLGFMFAGIAGAGLLMKRRSKAA